MPYCVFQILKVFNLLKMTLKNDKAHHYAGYLINTIVFWEPLNLKLLHGTLPLTCITQKAKRAHMTERPEVTETLSNISKLHD